MTVYGEWEDDKMVIHDSRNMNIIFEIQEMPDENSLLFSAARASIKQTC